MATGNGKTEMRFIRTAESVTRVTLNESKGTRRESVSPAFCLYRFKDAASADAVAVAQLDDSIGSGATIESMMLEASRDSRLYLHESEVGQALAAAQARQGLGRPSGKLVAQLVAQKLANGATHVVLGDSVVTLPGGGSGLDAESVRQESDAARARVPESLAVRAAQDFERAIGARGDRARLRSGMTRTLPAGE
jgi:hypothetical protein